jgi:uncharacterized protein YndB with AHSA1/START domain
MQAQVVTSISIKAKPIDVFEYLVDLKLHYLWNPQINDISSKERLALGSKYTTSSRVLGVNLTSQNVVTKFSNPKELEITNNTGTLKYTANFKLTKKDENTVVTCSTQVASDSDAFAFAKPVLKLLAKRELRIDLQSLKLAVEHSLD